jgi:nucleoside-diphosphate-sugar epimerase
MIIGRGDIASAIADVPSLDHADRIYFASGVSNSRETRNTEYQREAELLVQQDPSKHLVYFSSLSVFYAGTPYAQHKRTMEAMVRSHFMRHTIMRLGTIDWGENPNTIINYMRAEHKAGRPLKIENTYRYVLTMGEFHHWLGMIPAWPCEMNITGTRMTVHQIVNRYVLPQA